MFFVQFFIISASRQLLLCVLTVMSRRRAKRESAVNVGAKGTADPFVLMSDIVDRLHILEYENNEKGLVSSSEHSLISLTSTYFASSLNIAEQFGYFQSLCAWLFSLIGHPFLEWDDFQDPNSISNNILQECKKLKFPKEFASTKLRQGSGQEICEILDFVTNLAMKRMDYKMETPVFHKGMDGDELIEDVMSDDHDADDSDIEGSEDEDNTMTHKKGNYFRSSTEWMNEEDVDGVGVGVDDENEHKTTMSVMESGMTGNNKRAWSLELETVSHHLEDRFISGIKEWVTHLKKSKLHGKALKEVWPDSRAKLLKYSNKLSLHLERINAKETHLNREFAHLSDEYHTKYMKMQHLNKEYNENIARISTTTSNLQEMDEKINATKIEMENRNNTMTDMSPIRRLKESHNRLKAELIHLDLRIGVSRQQLLHSNMKHQARPN